MPRSSTRNTGSAAAGREQLSGTRPASRARQATSRRATADQPVATAPDQSDAQPTKAKEKVRHERPSGIDPTIDASAGQRALEQQREPA